MENMITNEKGEDRRIKLEIMYDGTDFCGWQVQKENPTVQGEMCRALKELCGKDVAVTGCSRTDAGVHANSYICHTDDFGIPPENIPLALGAHLSNKISVIKAEYATYDFHARYSCLGKEYIYKIWNAPYKNPFLDGYAMFYPKRIEEEKLRDFCEALCGTHDFRSFMAQGSKITDTVRTVKYCTLSRCGELLTLNIAADGFLYNMVRIIVGTLIDASRGKISPTKESALDIIKSQNRKNAGFTACACGLYLNKVFY